MDKMEKIMKELEQELATAKKRIAELENATSTSGKISSLYHSIFENFVESATDSFSIWDSNLNLIYINNATLKYHPVGTRKTDVIGKSIKELIPNAEKTGRYEKYRHVMETGEPLIIEDFKADPKYGDIYLSIKVFKISDGIGIVSSDITERKRMEQTFRDSEQRLSTLIENAPDIIFSYDFNGIFLFGNRKVQELLGYAVNELAGKSIAESGLLSKEGLLLAMSKVEENRRGITTGPDEFELTAKDGSHFFIEARGVPIIRDEGPEVICIAHDITKRKELEEKLRQDEEKFRAVFESIGDSVTVIDVNGKIVDLNDAAVQLFGCKNKEEALGMDSFTFIAQEDQPSATEKLLEGKSERLIQYKFKRMDGSTFWGETSSDVIRNSAGEITGFVGIVRDTTARKKMTEALQQSEERLRAYFDNAPDAIFIYDFNGVFLDGNRKCEEITGYGKAEIIGRSFIESGLFSEKYALKAMNAVLKDAKGKIVMPEEYEITRKDGQKRILEATSFVVKSRWKGEVVGIARDVTDRKKSEEALRQSEKKFRVIFNTIADGISVIDLTTGRLIDSNEAALHIFNFDREEIIGMNGLDLIAEKDRARAMEDLKHTLETGDSGLGEWSLLGKGGKEYLCEARSSVIYDLQHKPVYLLNVMRDISKRKELEEKLQQSEQKIRQIFNSVGVGITVTNMEGKVTEMNDFGLRLCGYSKDEIVGRNGITIIAENDRPRVIEEMISAFKTGGSVANEFTALKRDGTEYEVEAMTTVIRDISGESEGLIITITDISERKRIERELNSYKTNLEEMVRERTSELKKTYQELQENEQALKESEEKYRSLVEQLNQGIIIMQDNRIVFANKAMTQINGYSIEEMLNMTPSQVVGIAHTDTRDRLAKRIDERMQGKDIPEHSEWRITRRDGTERYLESFAVRIVFNGKPAIQATLMDITERKRMENALRSSEEKLRTMFTSMADGVIVTDVEGYFKDANMAALHMFGYSSKEDVRDVNGFDFISEKDRDLAIGDMAQLFSEGTVTGRSWRFKHSSGREFQAELSTALLKDDKGNPIEILVVIRNITERRKMEEALRDSEEWHRALVETSGRAGLGIAIIQNREGRGASLVFINDKTCEISGYSREELLGMTIQELIPIDAIEQIMLKYKERQQGESVPHSYETVFIRKDGVRVPIIASVALMQFQGKPATVAFYRDITDRKRIEEALRKSEGEFRTMFSSMADGVVVVGLDGSVKDLNEAMIKMFEHDSKEAALKENAFSNFVTEQDRDSAIKDMASLLNDRIPEERIFRFRGRKGRELAAEVHTSLLFDASGNPTDIMCVVRDITERKRINEALSESEAKLRAIYDSIGDGITVTDLKGNVIDLNAACLRLAGFESKEDALGINGLSFIAEVDRDRARNDMFNVLQKGIGITTEYRLVNRSGEEFDAEVSGAVITDSTGKPTAIVNVIRDISDRKQIEEALKESEAKYRSLVEQSEQGIVIIQNGRVVFANNALAKIGGHSLKEMYAMSPEESLAVIHPDDRDIMVKRLRSRTLGEKLMSRHEYRIRRKDGTERILEIYAKLITYKGKPAIQSTVADITERKLWEEKLKNSKDELRFYLNQITKAQEEERKRIARELHDDTIQELITLSRQIDDLVDKRIKPEDDRRLSRKKIEAARGKVTAILQGIREFTRDLRPSILDDLGLVPALEWLTSNMSARFSIPINVSIIGTEKNIAPDAALVMFRIAQESLNNAGNHSKASQIQVNLKYTSKTVILTVIDNGIGFTPPKQMSNLTKNGKLGIAGMYERAQLIDATLSVKSKRNAGTTVTLEVPFERPS